MSFVIMPEHWFCWCNTCDWELAYLGKINEDEIGKDACINHMVNHDGHEATMVHHGQQVISGV